MALPFVFLQSPPLLCGLFDEESGDLLWIRFEFGVEDGPKNVTFGKNLTFVGWLPEGSSKVSVAARSSASVGLPVQSAPPVDPNIER